ncbi:MAG: sigma-70 family RNA polymerase sigma factor [Bacteroidales bacterium]
MTTERELLQDLREGDSHAFTFFYHKYCQDVYSLSYKYLGSAELAEDMLQELFCQIWERRVEIDPEQPFNRYLFVILKHKLLNSLRDRKEVYSLSNSDVNLEELCYKPFQEDLTQEQLQLVYKAIATLSPQKRKVFELKLTGKYSNQEIANRLAVSVNTIKFQYSQSLKEIKTALSHFIYLWLLLNIPF